MNFKRIFLCYDFLNNSLPISLNVTFLPCIKIPILYILAAAQVVSKKPIIINITESASSHQVGALNGKRAIITIGDVNGKIEPNTAIPLLGSFNAFTMIKKPKKIGIVIGKVNELLSELSSVIKLPTAANNAAYKK